jgi:hypothetical protein
VSALLRRFGALVAFLAIALCGFLIAAQRPAASALCIVVALGILIEGIALMTNWSGLATSTAEQTRGLGDVLRFRDWEVRVIVGGLYVFAGVIFLGGGIHYL